MNEIIQSLRKRYSSMGKFLSEQGIAQLLVNYDHVENIAHVYNETPITLYVISESFPEQNKLNGSTYLYEWLRYLNEFLNINKSVPDNNLKVLSYLMYSKYKHFRLADLKLLFCYILESRYGTFYGSIDTQRLATSFYEYDIERSSIFLKITKDLEEQKEKLRRRKEEETYNPPDFDKMDGFKFWKNYGTGRIVDKIVEKTRV